MSAIKSTAVDTRPYIAGGSSNTTSWSDLDKTRLYGIGTGIYSGLTIVLHPLTVLKIRKQTGISDLPQTNNIRQYYRGIGVVVSLAIPARIIYVSALEYTREVAEQNARYFVLNPPSSWPLSQDQMQALLPWVTPLSGGLAGGVAALSSQLVVVPMDVISQKQMVATGSISARDVIKTIISTEGLRGLFRGFSLSLFTSLPAGSIWWATYAGSKDQLMRIKHFFPDKENSVENPSLLLARSGFIQVLSAFNAAVAAAVLTQPLDTIKTRLQVLCANAGNTPSNTSVLSIAKELVSTSRLYHGLLPRIAHMGIWGSVLSSAYEYLKVVSRKDHNI
ncbi:hypothetical protein HJC23_005031 [Cyclotella cryptica]|uniref:Mitochondrial carrier protein n=1 Tax=Cyclotella cryptica TaxID=29204 RepID=A0ABD3QDD3_9STRA